MDRIKLFFLTNLNRLLLGIHYEQERLKQKQDKDSEEIKNWDIIANGQCPICDNKYCLIVIGSSGNGGIFQCKYCGAKLWVSCDRDFGARVYK